MTDIDSHALVHYQGFGLSVLLKHPNFSIYKFHFLMLLLNLTTFSCSFFIRITCNHGQNIWDKLQACRNRGEDGGAAAPQVFVNVDLLLIEDDSEKKNIETKNTN